MKKIIKKVIRKILPQSVKDQLVVYNVTKPYELIQEESLPLKDQIAVVTGGSGALGRAICVKLASKGAKVYVSGRTKNTVQKVVDEILSLNLSAEPLVMDVADENSIESAFAVLPDIDILVNCAGGGARGEMSDLANQKVSIIDSLLSTNLRGTMLCTRQAAKLMQQKKRGSIVIISSAVGIQGKAKYSEYAAAKSGAVGFCKSMALELGEYGINVNCVSPGFIQRGEYTEAQRNWLKETNCLHAIGTPEDIANAVYFMVSDDAKFITGQNLVVDGGRTLGLYGDR